MSFFTKLFTKGGFLNLVTLTGPVVAGVLSGGVFTTQTLITAATGLAGKLAASWLNHDPK